MSAQALFRGPAHVLVGTNEEGAGILPEGAFGLPFREAFPQERYISLVALMDRVLADGISRVSVLPPPDGRITVCRWTRGQDRGVGLTVDLPAPESQRRRLAKEWSEPGAPRVAV